MSTHHFNDWPEIEALIKNGSIQTFLHRKDAIAAGSPFGWPYAFKFERMKQDPVWICGVVCLLQGFSARIPILFWETRAGNPQCPVIKLNKKESNRSWLILNRRHVRVHCSHPLSTSQEETLGYALNSMAYCLQKPALGEKVVSFMEWYAAIKRVHGFENPRVRSVLNLLESLA